MEGKEQNNRVTVDSLLKRAFLFLEDGDFQSANYYCERVLDIDPEKVEAYLGKLMAELGVDKIENFKNYQYPFDKSNNYQKILRFGSPELIAELEGIAKRNEQQWLSNNYNNAYNIMQSAKTEKEFEQAYAMFNSIIGFMNSSELAISCQNSIKEVKKRKILKKRKKIKIIIAILAIPLIVVSIYKIYYAIRSIKLDNANALYEAGKYDEAIEAYCEFENEYDCNLDYKIINVMNGKAKSMIKEEKFDEAVAVLSEIIDNDRFSLGVNSESEQLLSIVYACKSPRKTISAGYAHIVGLKADGTVVSVGDNSNGQCNVSDWKDIVAISAGNWHTVGLKADGTVVAVGDNKDGQCNVSNWKDIVAISAGVWHTVGLKADGTVVAVGRNDDGQCDVSGWKDIVAISAGDWHTVGLKSDGTVVGTSYGLGYSMHFDDFKGKAIKDIIDIAEEWNFSVALRKDGTVVVVGDDEKKYNDVANWKDIVAISLESNRIIGLKSDGTVVDVGNNDYGQCNVSDWTNIKIPETK